MASPILDAALAYIEKGWSIIPLCPPDHQGVNGEHEKSCKSQGKSPLVPWKQYQEQATTKNHAKYFWHKNPNANVGIVLGPVSGMIGLDLDSEDGEKLLLEACDGEIPNTLEFTTPGGMGSRRYLFKAPPIDIPIKSLQVAGKEAIRILAKGSQTVAPPSVHFNGGKYTWVHGHGPGEVELQECPPWLLTLIEKACQQPPPPPPAPPSQPFPQSSPAHDTPVNRARAYLKSCDPAVSGSGGHNQTFKVACKLVKGFELSTDTALQLLLEVYNPRCEPPWSENELKHKVESAAKAQGETGFLLNKPKLNGHHQAPTQPGEQPPPPPNQAHARSFDNIQTEAIHWLWKYWVALGKLTMLDGDPGLGKSTVLLDLAARVSTHGHMPDGSMGATGKVVIMSAEDAAGDTIKPRLIAAGAHLPNIIELSHVTWCGEERPPEIPKDLPLLDKIIEQHQAKLWIIDPLMAFLYGADANKDQEIRRVLYKLSKIAEKNQCAVIMMRHLNKSNNPKAIYRGNSSIGVIGHARVGLIVGEDPDNKSRRVLAQQKNNIGPLQKSLSYELQPDGEVCTIAWCGKSHYSADQLVALPETDDEKEQKQESMSKLEQAKQILTKFLQSGPKLIKDCKAECSNAGISEPTTKRAAYKLALELQCQTDPYGKNEYTWTLPGQNLDPIDPPPPDPYEDWT